MADDPERRTERIPLLMTPSEVQALDDWAFANRIRSRGEAIRRLIEAGIETGDPIPIRNPKPGGSDGGAEPGGPDNSGSGKSAPRSRKASAPERQPAPAGPAKPPSKEAQLRALREQGLG